MVGATLTIETEIEDTRNIRDVGVNGKRRESQSSSNSKKKTGASSSCRFQSCVHQSQGQVRSGFPVM